MATRSQKEWHQCLPSKIYYRFKPVANQKHPGSGNEVRAAVQYKLEVPPLEVYQRVTDQMRAQLEEEIRARGMKLFPKGSRDSDGTEIEQ